MPASTLSSHGAKRVTDILIAGLLLVALGPVMLLLAVVVRLTSPGPALFRQTRVGQFGRRFEMYKFRTMRDGCSDQLHREYVTRLLSDDRGGNVERSGLYKLDADPRVTRVGAALRRSSLDELPQLFNILRGDMSLVGPRPMLPWEFGMLTPAHRDRFTVPAGLTGLWQVSGRNKLTMKEALELDAEYVRRQSMALDLWIIAKTALILLAPGENAR